jgi:hypothetical protein
MRQSDKKPNGGGGRKYKPYLGSSAFSPASAAGFVRCGKPSASM